VDRTVARMAGLLAFCGNVRCPDPVRTPRFAPLTAGLQGTLDLSKGPHLMPSCCPVEHRHRHRSAVYLAQRVTWHVINEEQ
jgi:hypothetical protein